MTFTERCNVLNELLPQIFDDGEFLLFAVNSVPDEDGNLTCAMVGSILTKKKVEMALEIMTENIDSYIADKGQ